MGVELLSEYPEQLPMVTQFSNDSDAIKNFLQSTALAQSAGALSKEWQEEKLKGLEADPELKAMFDDIKQNGQEAFMKYLANDELMRKVSQKVGGISPQMLKHLASIQEASLTLHDAAKGGDLPKMQEFLKQKKDVNGRDLKGVTALGYAVGHDQISAVKLLMDAKANTDDVDKAGSSAVHFAAGYGRDQILELLLARGAAPSQVNQMGLTPLAVAMQNLAVSQQKQNLGNHAAVV